MREVASTAVEEAVAFRPEQSQIKIQRGFLPFGQILMCSFATIFRTDCSVTGHSNAMQATSESTTNHAAATAAAIDAALQIVPPTSAAAFPLDATTLMMRPVVAPMEKKVKKDATPKDGTSAVNAASLAFVNDPSKDQLLKLRGVGPVLAERILMSQPYTSLQDFIGVKGVGQKVLVALRAVVKNDLASKPRAPAKKATAAASSNRKYKKTTVKSATTQADSKITTVAAKSDDGVNLAEEEEEAVEAAICSASQHQESGKHLKVVASHNEGTKAVAPVKDAVSPKKIRPARKALSTAINSAKRTLDLAPKRTSMQTVSNLIKPAIAPARAAPSQISRYTTSSARYKPKALPASIRMLVGGMALSVLALSGPRK